MNGLVQFTIHNKSKLLKRTHHALVSFTTSILVFLSATAFAEDIELYLGDSSSFGKTRSQVLIIFDTSGSMGDKKWVKPAYNPAGSYDGTTGDNYIFYTKGKTPVSDIPKPSDASELRKFNVNINGCDTAKTSLAKYGFYTGRVRQYTYQGQSGKWSELLTTDGSNISLIDCESDINASNNANGSKYLNGGVLTNLPNPSTGYPIDGKGDASNPEFYTANVVDSNTRWGGDLVTLYSAKYLRWYHKTDLSTVKRSLKDIAQESVTNVINSAPEVDFGLQVFNYNAGSANSGGNGGRIAHGIHESTLTSRTKLLSIIENKLVASGNTPLCETLYEAAQYFQGKSIVYGKQSDNSRLPLRDKTIERDSNTKYTSPFSVCSNDQINVIIITDGEPTQDTNANGAIKALTSTGPFNLNGTNNYLAALAGWMYNNDLNQTLDGDQTAKTSTVGFGENAQTDAEPLLIAAAQSGGGEYYPADDSATLSAALNSFLSSINPSNDTLTSASVASNTFDRTKTLEYVYYAMFQPDIGPRWQGNIKKYKVIDGIQYGTNSKKAVDSKGYFSTDVQSYWSGDIDGNEVAQGGVAEMLRTKTDRTIYSDLGAAGALVEFNQSNAKAASAFGSQTNLATTLDVADNQNTINEYFDWMSGVDVDDADEDGDTTDIRPDVFGDPLHSKPIVLNYGNNGIYIAVGTNQGALHMFQDLDPDSKTGDVDEAWAFIPKDFFPNIRPLRENYSTASKIYGVDGPITSHIVDHNGNGIVDGADQAWLFFGLRRGGSSYYAINVTNPLVPSKMWQIKAGETSGFGDLGQTWSQPKVAYSKLNISGSTAKPVLFFGGGYDINKDNSGVGTADNVGKGIYMVDAENGTLKWSLTSSQFEDSIPSAIGTLDSDADGLTDRLYVGDTGGNVWRVDMPDTDTSKFSLFQLASFGHATSNEDDRRFFYEPSIVRTFITETIDSGQKNGSGDAIVVKEEIPYDAILIGSGDRVTPLSIDTKDVFYMIKDANIKTQEFTTSSVPATPAPLMVSDLFNYTDDPFKGLTGVSYDSKAKEVSEYSGWYFDFEQSGEKNTASALVINNVAYFTSFTPPDLTGTPVSCLLPSGQGWLYAVDLALGTKKYNWEAEDSRNREDRIAFISEQFLGAPTLIVTETDDGDPTTDDADGNIIVGRKVIPVGFNLETLRNYLYVDEAQ